MDAGGYSILQSPQGEVAPIDTTIVITPSEEVGYSKIAISKVKPEEVRSPGRPSTSQAQSDTASSDGHVEVDLGRSTDSHDSLQHGCSLFCSRYNDNVERASLSRAALPAYFILVFLPIGAAVLGVLGRNDCPACPPAPTLVFMVGIMGIVGMTAMTVQVSDICGAASSRTAQVINITCYIITLLLLSTLTMMFSTLNPSYQAGDPDYCHQIFYVTTLWMNWVGLVILIALAILYIPGWFQRRN